MTSPIHDYLKGLYSDTVVPERSFGVPTSLPYAKITVEDVEGLATSIKKVGIKMPFSWEALYGSERKGHYEPVGVKWVQYLRYLVDKGKFQVYRWLERSLHNSRHFIGPGGYDWDEADFKPFKQRMRWVSDE